MMKKLLLVFLTVVILMTSLSVGISASTKVTMYANDGRTATVDKADVKAWESVGWFTYPVTIVSKDGLGYVIAASEYDKYISRGYEDPYYNKNNILITFISGNYEYTNFGTITKIRVKLRVANNTKESLYIEPRDVTVGSKTVSAYFDIGKIPAKTAKEITLKVDNPGVSRYFAEFSFNAKIRTSSYSINERLNSIGFGYTL